MNTIIYTDLGRYTIILYIQHGDLFLFYLGELEPELVTGGCYQLMIVANVLFWSRESILALLGSLSIDHLRGDPIPTPLFTMIVASPQLIWWVCSFVGFARVPA
jgi:hypothetical protein